MDTYNYRERQSLFGYTADVHERSGGVGQLCGCEGREVDFDLRRQLTVEHLIGESQGGYLKQIEHTLRERFPEFAPDQVTELARSIDRANTVTAWSFCNSTTSRTRARIGMSEAIKNAPDGKPDQIFLAVISGFRRVIEDKLRDVRWKLPSVRRAFDEVVDPHLRSARAAAAILRCPEPSHAAPIRRYGRRSTSKVADFRAARQEGSRCRERLTLPPRNDANRCAYGPGRRARSFAPVRGLVSGQFVRYRAFRAEEQGSPASTSHRGRSCAIATSPRAPCRHRHW